MGFKPTTFKLMFPCLDIPILRTGICNSPINHFAQIGSLYSLGLSGDHKSHYCYHQQHYPEPVHQVELARNVFTYRPCVLRFYKKGLHNLCSLRAKGVVLMANWPILTPETGRCSSNPTICKTFLWNTIESCLEEMN